MKLPGSKLNPHNWLTPLLPLLAVVLAIRHWVWMPVMIHGDSMLPTLRSGQIVGLNKLAYVLRPPQRGDIVTIWTGKEFMAKRVVGLPGEQIRFHDGDFFLDAARLQEPYVLLPKSRNDIASGQIQDNCFVVAGDNRGPGGVIAIVTKDRIIGRIAAAPRDNRQPTLIVVISRDRIVGRAGATAPSRRSDVEQVNLARLGRRASQVRSFIIVCNSQKNFRQREVESQTAVLDHAPSWSNLPADRHNQGANIAFADGHVEHHKWLWPKRNWNPNSPSRVPENSLDMQDLIYTLTLSPVEHQ